MNVIVRRAGETDLQSVSQLAMKLVRQHQLYDPLRFVNFDNHESRLFELFRGEIQNEKSAVLVAELSKKIVGYALVMSEDANMIELSERRAWLHDIYVDESARGFNAGKQLLDTAVQAACDLGSRVFMLHVASQNEFARTLFEKNGFRPTMQEMMLDLSDRRKSTPI